jgi:outer membrane receptor for ferrienterochelin and colicin/opacity protein-like surface antigen
VPGLYVNRVTGVGQYTTLSMRGSTSAQVYFYVDGILQNVGNDMAIDLSLIPVSQVDRIEVYRGYIPARFAGAPIGGVVNIVTKKANALGLSAQVGLKSFGTQKYNVTATIPTFYNGTLLVGYNYDKSDNDFKFSTGEYYYYGYIPGSSQLAWRDDNSYESNDFLLKWQNKILGLKVGHKKISRELPFNEDTQVLFPSQKKFYRVQNASQTDIIGSFRKTFDKLDIGLQVSYINQNKDTTTKNFNLNSVNTSNNLFLFPGQIWSKRKTIKKGIQLDISYQFPEKNLIEIHGDYSNERLVVLGNNITHGASLVEYPAWYYPLFIERRAHLQIQDTFTFDTTLETKLTYIYRIDSLYSTGNEKSDNVSRSSWGLAFTSKINDNFSYRATWGTFNHFPNFTQRFGDGIFVNPYWTRNNPTEKVRWEEGTQWDAGIDWRGNILNAKGQASVTFFARQTRNIAVLHYLENKDGLMYKNSGYSRVQGVEIESLLNWDNFSFTFSGTYQHGSINESGGYLGTGTTSLDKRLPGLPKIEYYMRASYNIFDNKVTLFSEYNYAGKIPLFYAAGLGHHIYLSQLGTVNSGLLWKVNDNINITLGVNDLLNKSQQQYLFADSRNHLSADQSTIYRSTLEYPWPGRTYYATLNFSIGDHNTENNDFIENILDDNSFNSNEKEDSIFYIAPKITYSKLYSDLSGENWNFFNNGTTNLGFRPLVTMGPTYTWLRPGDGGSARINGGAHESSGMSGGLAFGIDLHKISRVPLRLELEGSLFSQRNIGYSHSPVGDYSLTPNSTGVSYALNYYDIEQILKIDLATISVNAFFDFHNSTRLTPYFGASFGVTRYHNILIQDFKLRFGKNSGTTQRAATIQTPFKKEFKGWQHTWSLSAGLSYQLTPATYIDFSYRYINYGNFNIPIITPNTIVQDFILGGPASGYGHVMMYADSTGQKLKLYAHQAVLAFRIDLGAGRQAIEKFNKKANYNSKGIFDFLNIKSTLESPPIKQGAFTFSTRYGIWLPSTNFSLQDAQMFSLGIGYNITRNFALEGSFDVTNHTQADSMQYYQGRTRVYSTRLNAIYNIINKKNDKHRLVPYITLGVGTVWTKGNFKNATVAYSHGRTYTSNLDTSNYNSFAVNGGIGVKFFATKNVALRFEANDNYSFKHANFGWIKSDNHNLSITGGLHFQFGGK